MNIILFEDSAAKQLSPVSLTRPAWAIRCGSFCLADLLDGNNIRGIVRPHLQTLLLNDWPEYTVPYQSIEESMVMVNARIVPTICNFQKLESFISSDRHKPNQITLVRNGWALAAAIIPASISASLSDDVDCDRVSELETLAKNKNLELASEELQLDLLDYPHDIIAHHMKGCGDAIEYRLKNGNYREVKDGVFVAIDEDSETVIPPDCSFDTRDGAVVFESNVRIGPFCFFRGPVHVGNNSKISEHSSIKDSVAISHTCKMGGEIEGVQTEPWSNKQHFGFLGHSYMGSWINLGAGTSNSDLKNTYGTVNMTYGTRKVSTGMQFVGCVMGDYSRTAINTSIFTGKIVGVGSSVYGMTPHNVPSFVNCAQQLNQYGVLPPEVLATTQKRMFGRRNVPQRPCDIQLIHELFAMTQHERDPSWTTDPIPF